MSSQIVAALQVAAQLRSSWQLDAAEDRYRELCAYPPLYPRTLTEVAITLGQQSRGAEALQLVEQAEATAEDDAPIAQNRLILEKLREPEQPQQFVELHRRFGERHAPSGGDLFRARAHAPLPRPLRIAYLGVDAHLAMARFVPILAEHHDRQLFHPAFFYGTSDAAAIAAAKRRWPKIAHVDIQGIRPRDLAVSLVQGGVDIAVDLVGHGRGSVLAALAYKPAPLQVTWLDYVATTGVSAIDARLCDIWTDPPDRNAFCTEQPLRLSVPQWCALPPRAGVAAPRAADSAPIIGIVNATSKTSPRLVDLAARILARLPTLRLRVIGAASERARAALLAHVPEALRDRVELHGRLPEAEYHALLGGVDLALDPPAFSGATTTLDCLHAGIPVLTVPGQLPHTRSSASILGALGLDRLIASDDDDFVTRALHLLADRAALNAWRAELPVLVRASSLTDPARFMPHLETALRDSYQQALRELTAGAPWLFVADSGARRQALAASANAALRAGNPHRAIYALETLALASGNDASIRAHLVDAYRTRANWHQERLEPRMAYADREQADLIAGVRR